MINIVSATRLTEEDFWEKSALGLSLLRLQFDKRLKPCIAYENKLGLPSVYNAQIVAATNDDILVFVHDDVWVEDLFFADRIIDGLKTFGVIGVAGNKRRLPNQPGWNFSNINFEPDAPEFWSGIVAHGQTSWSGVLLFGPSFAECELLDGVFLAAHRKTLVERSVFFDPRFDFHFYDLDFCRTARLKQMKIGTWPISLTHQSAGVFGTPQWRAMYRLYIEKWGE